MQMNGSDPMSSGAVGLRLLIQSSEPQSNVINKSVSVLITTVNPNRQFPSQFSGSSFLKACHLCNKELTPFCDVYMYRGNQGYCSEQCRCRQILMDEMREKEAFARKWKDPPLRSNRRRRMLQSSHHGAIRAVG